MTDELPRRFPLAWTVDRLLVRLFSDSGAKATDGKAKQR